MLSRLPLWSRCALLLILAWLAGSWWLSGELMTPRRRAPPPPPSVEGLVSETLTLRTDDGLDIAAWVVAPERAPGAACVLLHPMDGTRSPVLAAFVAARGLGVVTLDLRGHGESDGARSGFGWHERAEVRAAVAEARRRWPDLPLLGMGTSLGAAALVYSVDPAHADSLPPDTFDALVLESLYADAGTAFLNRVDLAAGRWALPLALPTRWLVARRTGLDEALLSPEHSLARLAARSDVELLLATGDLDRLSTPDELRRLAAASGGRAVLVKGGHHADLYGQTDGSWMKELRAFFDGWGRGGG